MGKTYIVAPGHEFNYPADSFTLKTLKNAGGRSNVPEKELKALKFKSVKAGDDCSDMPTESLELYFSRGWILETHPVVEKETEKEING